MDIQQIEAFIAISETLSFSKAASQLHITQPAISKRIAALEIQLDCQLFERLGHQVLLSEAGQQLLPHAKSMYQNYQELIGYHHTQAKEITGNLRIATSHHIGLYRLPQFLKQFVQQFPKVQLDMHFTDSEIAYQEVIHGQSDLAIATLPLKPNKSIHTEALWQDELVVMFSCDHPLKSANTITLKQLAQHPAILPDHDTFTRRIIDLQFTSAKIRYQLAFTTNYLETIKVMVEAGLGWSILPKIMASNRLLSRPLQKSPPTRDLGLMIHQNKSLTPATQVFIDNLRQFNKQSD